MANRYTIRSGNSNDNTAGTTPWDGNGALGVPVTGDRVLICASHTVTLNGTHVWGDDDDTHNLTTVNLVSTYDSITVYGTLKLSRAASSSLKCRGSIYFGSTSAFDGGKTGDQIPIAFTHLITLGYTTAAKRYGLFVESSAAWDAWGFTRTRITPLATAYSAGNIVVTNATGWQIGDTLYLPGGSPSADQAETVTIAGTYTPGSTTVPLTGAPTFAHAVGLPIVNLTSNVGFKSDNAALMATAAFYSYHLTPITPYRTMRYVTFEAVSMRPYESMYSGSGKPGFQLTNQPYNTNGVQISDVGIYTAWLDLSDTITWYGAGNEGATVINAGSGNTKPFGGSATLNRCAAIGKSVGGVAGFLAGWQITFNDCFGSAPNPLSNNDAGSVVSLQWNRGYLEFKGDGGTNSAAFFNCDCFAVSVNNAIFFGNCYRAIDPRFGDLTFTGCDLFYTFGGASDRSFIYDQINAVVTLKDCLFAANLPVTNSVFTASQATALVSVVNKNLDLNAQEIRSPYYTLIRDNAIRLNSSSSMKVLPTAAGRPFTFTEQIPCVNGGSIRVLGNCQQHTDYYRQGGTTSIPPTVTISGLGITPVVYTSTAAAVSAWENFDISATNSSGADGNFTLTYAASAKRLTYQAANLSCTNGPNAGGTASFTRTVGSWITDGWKIGDTILSYGWTNAVNNGTFIVTGVAALTLLLEFNTSFYMVAEANNAAAHVDMSVAAPTGVVYFDGTPTLSPMVTKARWYGFVLDENNPNRVVDGASVANNATALGYAAAFTITGGASSSPVAIINDTTFQKFYDYGIAWACTIANFVYASPIAAPVLGSLIAKSNITITTAKKLNGPGSVAMGSFSLSTEFVGALAYTYTGGTWSQVSTVPAFNGGTVNLPIQNTLTFSATGLTLNFNPTSNGANYHLDACVFSGTITVTNTSGHTMNLYVPVGTTISNSTSGANQITVITPTVNQGLAFTGLQSGSKVVIFTTTTQTALYTDASSGTTSTFSQTYSADITVDYTIQKVGFSPIRVTGVLLQQTVQTTPIQQIADRAYVASSGLAFGSTATVNTGTKRVTVTVVTTVENWYSFMVESWISQSVLANVQFPFSTNGPNSYTLGLDWEWTSGISFLSRGGMRYVTTAGAITAIWSGILSIGPTGGLQAIYQQTNGSGTTNAANTGAVDQLIQVYGDSSHGNFDKRTFLVFKVQKDGFDQAEADVVATYGNVQDQLYVIGLAPTPNSIATGNPSLANTPVITDLGASPLTFNALTFSVKIVDSATPNTGTGIMRYLRYFMAQGGTFQGKTAFNWHDLVQANGSFFKSVRGNIWGGSGLQVKGVAVFMNDGVTAHPDFTTLTADNGSVWNAPVFQGASFTGLQAGSKVVIFNTATQTAIYTDASSGTTSTFSQSFGSNITVDYTIQKVGFLPIRVTGVVLPNTIQTIPIQQAADRAYFASSGLIFGSTATVNSGTKRFTVTVPTTVENWYSFMIESWIAQSALANVQFPLTNNGPNSFTLGLDWEWTSGISFLSRDGMRYVSTGGTQTAVWAAILSIGPAAGIQVIYQQINGSGTANTATTGPVDQLIQVYGDSSHGNFDKRGFLVFKVQKDGYDQAEADVVGTYGTLEDQFYVISLSPTLNGLATGDPVVSGVTLTDLGASPVTFSGNPYSVKIVDSASPHTGTQLMRWLRYSYGLGGTFQGKPAFDWHDLIQTSGTKFKTLRGTIWGGTGATLKGVVVYQNDGTTPHPDFTTMMSDNGSVYTAPITASINISGLTVGSRVQLYDLTSSTELYNAIVPGTTAGFSQTYTVDRSIRLRVAYCAANTGGSNFNGTANVFIDTPIGSITSAAPILNYQATPIVDSVYVNNLIDGPIITDCVISGTSLLVGINAGATTWQHIYGFMVYWLTTVGGIRDQFLEMVAIDQTHYIFNSGHGGQFKIKNITSPSVPLLITGGNAAPDTGSVTNILDTTGGTIFCVEGTVVAFNTGGSMADVQAILKNKHVLNPTTGIETVYDNNGAVLFTRQVYEDAAGTQPYRGQGAERTEKFQ